LAGVACECIYAGAFLWGGWGVGRGFSELSESVIGFECYLYIRVFEQVRNFSN